MLRIRCLVDNSVLGSSEYWGEHGLVLLVETDHGRVLLDTGRSGTVLLHNLKQARIDPASITALALSHAHYDHTGGLAALLPLTGRIPVYAHPDIFRERFARHGRRVDRIGPALSREELEALAELHLSAESQQVLPGVFTTGEIRARGELEGRGPNHLIRDGKGWATDPYRDDLALVLQSPRGLALVCGCCHAGLLNTLQHVRDIFPGAVRAVLGGTHLGSLSETQMDHIVQALRDYGELQVFPNHCTGQPAYVTLAQAFGARVHPFPAGAEVTF